MNVPLHMSNQAKKVLEIARKRGLTGLEKLMFSSQAMMPSVEELNAELGGNLIEKGWDALVVHNSDHTAA